MEGGASPASLLSDEKLPKPAQKADYHRNKRAPAARSTVMVEVLEVVGQHMVLCRLSRSRSDTVCQRA